MAFTPRLLSDVDPDEVSLVAKPANKRRFLLRKGADVNLDPEIADMLSIAAENEGSVLDLVRKNGGDETTQAAVALAMRALSGVELSPEVVEKLGTELYPRKNPPLNQLRSYGGGDNGEDSELNEESEDEEGDEMDEMNEVAVGKTKKDPDNDGDDDTSECGDTDEDMAKAEFSTDDRKNLAGKGEALPDGSYPIRNKSDLHNAIQAFGRAKDKGKAKAWIMRRAKALGATSMLPESWSVSKSDSEQEKGARVDTHTGPVQKEDGTWDLSGVPAENRAFLESVQKQAEEQATALLAAQEQIKKADEKASELGDKLRMKELVQKAEDEFGKVGPADDIAEILKAASESFSEDTYAKLEQVLKAADAKIETGDLFTELGAKFSGSKGSTGAYAEAVAKADEIVTKGDAESREVAMGKVWADNPGLYERYLNENPAQTSAFGVNV